METFALTATQKQELLAKYEKYEPFLKSCQTNKEMAKVFAGNKSFFDAFFSMCQEEILNNNFSVVYQPIVNNSQLKSAEALFRLKINDTTINPMIVFSMANFYGFEKDLNLTILSKICEDVKTFKQEIDPDFRVSFNVNPELLTKEFFYDFYNTISNSNKQTGEQIINNNNIAIELSEASSFANIDKNVFQSFLDNGTKMYLDDYGTGFANLYTLKSLPFTHLKFAGDLVSGIDQNFANQNIIANALDYCKKNDISPIFEHVETKDELKTVHDLSKGDYSIQGYIFSKPLLPDELVDYAHIFTNNEPICGNENNA